MLNHVHSYINRLRASYKAILKNNASRPVLRLISEECKNKNQEKDISFRVQVTGKNLFPVVSVKKLNKSSIISNFSKEDQAIIPYYFSGVRVRQLVSKRIVARTYDREAKLFNYTIECIESGSIIKNITTNDLALLSNNLFDFDKDDARLIELELKKRN